MVQPAQQARALCSLRWLLFLLLSAPANPARSASAALASYALPSAAAGHGGGGRGQQQRGGQSVVDAPSSAWLAGGSSTSGQRDGGAHAHLDPDPGDAWKPLLHETGRSGGRRLAAKRKSGAAAGQRKPGRRSPYVSLGRVRAFTGDVHPSPSLALALANRAYQKEVILVTDTRATTALQLFENLAQLGLVHVLWLTSSHSSCAALDKLVAARAELYGGMQQRGGGVQPQLGTPQRRRLVQAAAAAGSGEAAAAAGASAALNSSVASIAALAAAASGSNSGNPATAPAISADDLMGCAWDSQPFPPGFAGHRRLMMMRVMLLARAVRLGFNVLSLDTDVILYRDPYPSLKSPPYGSMQMVVGRSVRSGGVVNTGVMYVQNASASGAVAWALGEVVERNLRWIEHNVSMPHMQGAAGGGAPGAGVPRLMPYQADTRGCWDQLLFGDVVLSGMTGKAVLMFCARPSSRGSGGGGGAAAGAAMALAGRAGGRREEDTAGWTERHRAAFGLKEKQGPNDLMVHEETAVTGSGATTLVAAASYTHTWVNLTIPVDAPPLLPDEPGYSLPSLKRGGTAEAFQQLLAADAAHLQSQSKVSRRLSNVGQAAGLSPQPSSERLSYAADWLIGGWPQRGALGYWDPQLTRGKPKQVGGNTRSGRGGLILSRSEGHMAWNKQACAKAARATLGVYKGQVAHDTIGFVFGHLVRAPGPTGVGKDAVRMQYGEYNWALAALAAGGPFPFLGSADAAVPPRLVALLPEVDTATESAVQWSNMARGLVQIGLLTGRQVVWPSVPCSSRWVAPNPGARRSLPLSSNLRFLAHGQLTALQCTPASTFHPKCLYERQVVVRNGSAAGEPFGDSDDEEEDASAKFMTRVEGPRGMLPAEFAMLLRLLPPAEVMPGPHNTVHLQSNDESDEGGAIMFDEPPRTAGISYVEATALAEPLRQGALASQRVLYLAQRTFVAKMGQLNDTALMAKYRAFRNECPALK
ncbi:hypothetical protein TSOC_008666 [Tetrabaena socialis]|uniref:Nucleotide-diphospho-sugar transferase domain-containing protein n=1 Tax=Tetrabaena socialis TaxID=47790 RepID=A0A2J7ZXV6_9CHLO|nr:hypothetical protein TSOC_008666 [Tetrabaena socialis]|eukprot:PNH05103.1 hypothetical protein TSOC_008666 [Tetrabaena socialis]